MTSREKPGSAADEPAGAHARRAESLSVLNTIATEASKTLDLRELLDIGLEQMMGLTGMEGGAVLLVDEETQQMTLAAQRNFPQAAKDLIEREPLAVGEAIPGIAAERCQLLIVENSKDDERELPPFREIGVMTHVCIPLAVRGRALGVLGMMDRRLLSFKPEELELFSAVGVQLGIAVERARVFERQASLTERLHVLNELMRIAVSSLDMAEAFERIGEQVRKLIDHDRFSIAMRPPGKDYVEDAFAADSLGTPYKMRVPLRESPPGEVILTGRPILRKNFPDDSVYPIESEMAEKHGFRSCIFVPLESKGRVIGSLILRSLQPGKYCERELQIAQEIADHLAVIVEHTLLDEQSKQADAVLRRLNKELAEANRHKSEFLANLSHELRTPLNAILGGSELLAQGLFGPLTDKQAEYIGDIYESGSHLLSLINDVLDLSKVEAGKLDLQPTHFGVRSLMERGAVIVRERAANKSLEMTVIPPPEDVVIEADERKIKQVVYNLLSNAVKFTPENGRVVFSAHRDGEEVVFAVEDNGPGVPAEFRERIFEEFVQTPGRHEGTGLGLALSKRFVELHGGRIWLETEVGRGSEFSFAIPVACQASTGSGDVGAGQ